MVNGIIIYICTTMLKSIKVVLLGAFLAIQISCLEEPDCLQAENNFITLSFYSAETGAVQSIFIDSVFSEQYIGNFFKNTETSSVTLPLSSSLESMSFVVQSEFTRDTLDLAYEYKPRLYGLDCEISAVYDNILLVEHTVDSIQVKTNEIPLHVKIYY